jgi:hypothetical protein
MSKYNVQDLMKLQEQLSDSIFSSTKIVVMGQEYLVPVPELEMFIENLIISLQNGDIPNA